MRKGVKVCGLMSETDLKKASVEGARAVGVICRSDRSYAPSVRSHTVPPERARKLRQAAARHGLEFVLVPRTSELAEIVDLADYVKPDRVQLGQVEDPEITEATRVLLGGDNMPELAQVIHVNESTTPDVIDDFAVNIDYVHLDSGGHDRPGGTGQVHDWQQSQEIAARAHDQGKLVILAGGLTVHNVAEAINLVRPDGVDVESGIRSQYDIYDQSLIRDFVEAAEGATI